MASEQERREGQSGALERLFMYWLISTLLLVLCCAAVVVYTYGALTRQADAVEDLQGQIESLEGAVEGLREAHSDGPGRRTPTDSSERPMPQPDPPTAVRQPTAVPERPDTPVQSAGLDEATVRDGLREVTSVSLPQMPDDIVDATGASKLVDRVLAGMRDADWRRETWLRLALMARLVGRDAPGETFARRAAMEEMLPLPYLAVSARTLLARGRVAEALPFAERLAKRTAPSPLAKVLLASALLESEQAGAADELLRPLPPVVDLLPYDRLTLARTLLQLERWKGLESALAGPVEWPEPWITARNLMQAVLLGRQGRTVEALAALDYLAAHWREGDRPAWSRVLPDAYEIEVWRGVTLIQANQNEAARRALMEAASRAPGRPAAHYQLGMLALRAGELTNARSYFENAVTCAERMAPAWEALGLVAVNTNEIDAALESLQQAIEINPYRASAHFLVALAEAKRSQRAAAADALRRAFALDGDYLDEARSADVLLRLFTREELEAIAQVDNPDTPDDAGEET